MKRTILAAYSVFLFAAALPWILGTGTSPGIPSETAAPTAAVPPVLSSPPSAQPSPTPIPAPAPTPEPLTLRVLIGGEVTELDMEDYIVGVTAAEMPASVEPEALKAQTVAARSYALYCAAMHKHGEADVCTDPGCCQAWCPEEEMRSKWGECFEANRDRLLSAAAETRGETLRYEGEPIFAAFHSSSAGMTEACGEIWSPLPYLLSVSSPETAGDVPGYVSAVYCSPIDLRDTVLSAHPEADFSADESTWLGAELRDGSGRIAGIWLGGTYIPGTELRRLFSLRSTAFTLEALDGQFVFTVVGYGHGVGMSQYGANVMAQQGTDYREILSHYYPGTELVAA